MFYSRIYPLRHSIGIWIIALGHTYLYAMFLQLALIVITAILYAPIRVVYKWLFLSCMLIM